ncbi:hypothetical protein HNR33_002349 [Brassicibacter mesophilus]
MQKKEHLISEISLALALDYIEKNKSNKKSLINEIKSLEILSEKTLEEMFMTKYKDILIKTLSSSK